MVVSDGFPYISRLTRNKRIDPKLWEAQLHHGCTSQNDVALSKNRTHIGLQVSGRLDLEHRDKRFEAPFPCYLPSWQELGSDRKGHASVQGGSHGFTEGDGGMSST